MGCRFQEATAHIRVNKGMTDFLVGAKLYNSGMFCIFCR